MSKVVLVIGPCGAGKTTTLRRVRAVLGPRVGEVAVLETDTTFTMIDPTWSTIDHPFHGPIVTRITARIAGEFVREGFDWVVVGSNGLQDAGSVNDFVARLPAGTEVHRIFLDPSVAAVQERVAERNRQHADPIDDHKTPQWLATNVAWMRGFHDSWSAVIDNSTLDVDQTVDAIYATVRAGAGRIIPPLPTWTGDS